MTTVTQRLGTTVEDVIVQNSEQLFTATNEDAPAIRVVGRRPGAQGVLR